MSSPPSSTPSSIRWYFISEQWEPTYPQLERISSLIQPEEKERIGRFYFIKDAKSSLIGRLMLRKFVRGRTGVENNLIKLGRDDLGKPFLQSLNNNEAGDLSSSSLDNPPSSPSSPDNLNFNVSHQGRIVVLASEKGADLVGIDVMDIEKPGKIADSVDEYFRLMNRQFTDNEWRQIKGLDIPLGGPSLSDRKKMTNFTRFWCLKESYVKATGTGITISLKSIDFQTKTDLDFEKGKIFADDTTLKVQGCLETWWKFEEYCLDKNHLVAVAKRVPNLDESKSESDNGNDPPSFTEVSLDFLLEDMTPLTEPDEDWARKFLEKKRR